MATQSIVVKPGYRADYNINPYNSALNSLDDQNNPTGGSVGLIVDNPTGGDRHAVMINWQDGPRGTANGGLAPPNGAFVEDVLWAALQRLEFFQGSKYRDRANALAITHIEQALQALKDRQLERSYRGVEGKHEV